MAHEDLLRSLYVAFNARETDKVLEALAPDVAWPNGWEGGWVHGHEEVREYWRRQWAEVDPTVEPEAITERDDGCVEVTVHQVVKDLDGEQLSDDRVLHVYRFDGDLVSRMEIEEAPNP